MRYKVLWSVNQPSFPYLSVTLLMLVFLILVRKTRLLDSL